MKPLYILLSICFTLTLTNCKSQKKPTNLNASPPAVPIGGAFSVASGGKHFVIVEIRENYLTKVDRIRNMQNQFTVSLDDKLFLTAYPEIKVGSCYGNRRMVVIREFKNHLTALDFIVVLDQLDILSEIEKPVPISEENFYRIKNCNTAAYLKFYNKTFVNTSEAMKQ